MTERRQRGQVAGAPPPPVIEFTVHVQATLRTGSPQSRQEVQGKVVRDLEGFSLFVRNGSGIYDVEAEIVEEISAPAADAPEAS